MQADPKSLYLSKIREKSLKIWAKALKIQAKIVRSVVWLHKIAPNVCRKYIKTFFLEATPKWSWWFYGRKFIGKSRTKTCWATLGKSGQTSFEPQKIFLLLQHLWSGQNVGYCAQGAQLDFLLHALHSNSFRGNSL